MKMNFKNKKTKDNLIIGLTNSGRQRKLISEMPYTYLKAEIENKNIPERFIATVYKGNIIKNLIMDCQSYTKYRPNETTGGIFVSWRRKEELPTGA